ncbi:MAG: hypothetical protein Q4A82_00825 [Corynebacterium sp.]|nr:hypothetical protein [Corynebacterium sp.]
MTPLLVRIGSSALFGLAVAILSTDLPKNIRALAMVICIGAGTMLIFRHPYRKEIQRFFADRNLSYKPRMAQLVPLIMVWFALLLAPAFAPAPMWGSILGGLVIFGWMWVMFPIIDGTRIVEQLKQNQPDHQGT